MLDPLVLIKEYGPAVGLAIFFAIVVMMAVRSWMATNDKIRLQKSEMESIRLQISANEAKHKIEMETQAAKQREEMEDEAAKREQKLLREIRGLYEKRLDDYHTQITALEAQRVTDKKDLDEQRVRIEKLASDLSEQKLLLQAEKRAYAELETFNESLQRNNDNLTRQNAELIASEAEYKNTIDEMKRRLDVLAQRVSDLEQDIRYKDNQIVNLQNQVLGLKQVTVTGENPTVNVAEAATVATPITPTPQVSTPGLN